MPALFLKTGREKSLLRRHPWIFSGAVERLMGDPAPGETVDILASNGTFLARAAYSPHSQIRARVWTFNPSENIDKSFFQQRIRLCLSRREHLFAGGSGNASRLVHAESDGLPGLIVDRYANILVLQALSMGIEFWKEQITGILQAETGVDCILERSDAEVRNLEGLPEKIQFLVGNAGMLPDQILENGAKFLVNFLGGQKTGFYLDQRVNRQVVRQLSTGKEVLDCFSYSGGFTVNALLGGASSVISLDSSAESLELCRKNVELNGLSSLQHARFEGDAFSGLRKFRDEGQSFDLVILDPPKFAPTAAHVEKAARAYKDINLLAFKLLRPGGTLVTFSCSGGVSADLFQKIVAGAVLDAGLDARILAHLEQSPDHPVGLHFPEGSYLKGLVCVRE